MGWLFGMLFFVILKPVFITLAVLSIVELVIISKKGEGNKTPWIILLVIAGSFTLLSIWSALGLQSCCNID